MNLGKLPIDNPRTLFVEATLTRGKFPKEIYKKIIAGVLIPVGVASLSRRALLSLRSTTGVVQDLAQLREAARES